MLDSGLPLATESNILKDLIKPPSILRRVKGIATGDSTKYVNMIIHLLGLNIDNWQRRETSTGVSCSSVSNTLPSSQLSNIPWRRQGVRYTNNEAYFDLIEEIDAIIDRNGVTVMCEIQGYVSEWMHACCIINERGFFMDKILDESYRSEISIVFVFDY